MLKDVLIVILDEATASVDADNESYIQLTISELCRGKTLPVIARRLDTIRNADQILVAADGRIAQSGIHEALMEQPGSYRGFVTVRENSCGWNNRRQQVDLRFPTDTEEALTGTVTEKGLLAGGGAGQTEG